jgi:WS/DGAT/MGAT family acyltransferase
VDDLDDFEFASRMSDADALMWSIEKDPLLRSTITFITLLDQAPDRDRFRTTMDRVSRVVPRLRQRVTGHPYSIAPPRWAVDPNFDLDYHLRFMAATGDGSTREVLDLAQPIAMQGFDRARPLWEFTVVEGLEGGRAAVIGKVHHAITDGVGGVKLQMEMLDIERDPVVERPMPEAPEPDRLGEADRVLDALAHESRRGVSGVSALAGSAMGAAQRLLSDPVGVGADAVRTTLSMAKLVAPATAPLSPIMTERSLSVRFHMLQLPLADLKGAARTVRGRLNDAFVAGVAGGLHRYHAIHGLTVPALRMTMPISTRVDTVTGGGNQFVPARFAVPTHHADPISTMSAIRELVAQERAEPALALSDQVANVLNRLPVTATTGIFGAMLKGVDFVTSNVPGAPIPVYLAGARMDAQIALGPLSGSAMNVTLLSYCDDVNIGINIDPAAVPDVDVMIECLAESFAELCALA